LIDGTSPQAVLEAIAANMERFGICRLRHDTLTNAVRLRQESAK
jgi:hypothetical protein